MPPVISFLKCATMLLFFTLITLLHTKSTSLKIETLTLVCVEKGAIVIFLPLLSNYSTTKLFKAFICYFLTISKTCFRALSENLVLIK